MKLEFLHEGSSDCPLLRLYDFSFAEAGKLFSAFNSLAALECEQITLGEIVHVESVDGSSLTFACGKQNLGVSQSSKKEFSVILTPTWWENVAGLTEPFCTGSSNGWCHQWLTEGFGRIRLLLSPTGAW